MCRILQIVTLLLVTSSAFGATVEADLSPQDAKIGDRLLLDLRVQGTSPTNIQFPFPDAEHFTLLGIDSSRLKSEGRLQYRLAVYDTGQYVLPEMAVIVADGATAETLYTPQLGVRIRSIAPDTASTILPLKPYREHPFRWKDVWRAARSSPWTWLCVGLLLFTTAWVIWRRYFRRKPVAEIVPVVALPPDEQAVRDLIALRDKRYPARGMMKEFFSEYSQIMRTYLERRYEFPALEMTTFDLEREFEYKNFPAALASRLLPTFHEADLVKFAKYIPPIESCDSVLETGFEIVALTKPQDAEPEEAKAA